MHGQLLLHRGCELRGLQRLRAGQQVREHLWLEYDLLEVLELLQTLGEAVLLQLAVPYAILNGAQIAVKFAVK